MFSFRVEKQRAVVQEKLVQVKAAQEQQQAQQQQQSQTAAQIKAQLEIQLKQQRLAMQQKRLAEQKGVTTATTVGTPAKTITIGGQKAVLVTSQGAKTSVS